MPSRAKNEVWLSRTPPKLSFRTVSVKGDCAPTAVLLPTFTDGVSRTKSMKSRPEMGRSLILGVSITWLTSDFSVSIPRITSCTCTSSVTVTPRVTTAEAVCPTDRACDSVTSLRLTPVWAFLIVTVAPGITAPVWSFTVTFKVASSWPSAFHDDNRNQTTAPTNQTEVRFMGDPFPVRTGVCPLLARFSCVEKFNKPTTEQNSFPHLRRRLALAQCPLRPDHGRFGLIGCELRFLPGCCPKSCRPQMFRSLHSALNKV